MSIQPSQFLEAASVPADLASRPIVRVRGEDDEPERFIVLVATALRGHARSDLIDACTSRSSPWRDRKDAFHSLLFESKGHGLVVFDPDAMYVPASHELEAPLARRRDDVSGLFSLAVGWGGWTLVRTAPSAALSDRIDVVPEAEREADAVASLSPCCRPLAEYLFARGVLHAEDLEDIFEQVADPDEHVIRVAYDTLTSASRETARKLAALRSPSHSNGAFGCLGWADAPGTSSVPRQAVDELARAGFLQAEETARPKELVMPRLVRRYVRRQAELVEPEALREVHLHCARALANVRDLDAESSIERHVHATRSGDVDLALDTAEYFGSALRELATRISREEVPVSGPKASRFEQAARIFQVLVERFDAEDAYSWEYLGYNLARFDAEARARLRNCDRIREAYERAHRLAPRVPLYHGRWLGYRAELGEDIERELESALMRYAIEYKGEPEPVSYFVEAVINGLRRGERQDVIARISSSWRTLLVKFARGPILEDG